MEKMEAKKTPPSSPLALLPDTPSGLSSAPRQMSSREMVREKVNRIKEKAAAQKAERASSSSSRKRNNDLPLAAASTVASTMTKKSAQYRAPTVLGYPFGSSPG